MSDWPALPVFLAVAGRPVILLGHGEAAAAKRRLLERAGALVTGDRDADARLAIVAIEDEADAQAAIAALKARGVLVNAVDRPAQCDATLPAIVDRAPVLVAIGTGGVSAGLAAAIRQRLERLLSPKLGALARLLHDHRPDLREAFPDAGDRRRAIGAALAPGGIMDADDPCLDDPFWMTHLASHRAEGGGGAVGVVRIRSDDPDELTLRQARLLAQADAVYHQPGVPAAILDRGRADAPRIAATAMPEPPANGAIVYVEAAG